MPRNPVLNGLSEAQRKQRSQAQARARKKRFDARMRNLGDGLNLDRRHAVVVYLTEDAKQVLRQHRLQPKQVDSPPVLDSVLIDALLIDYAQRLDDENIRALIQRGGKFVQVEGSTPVAQCDDLSLDPHAMHLRHLASQRTIADLKSKLARRKADEDDFSWKDVEDELLDSHRRHYPMFGTRLAQQLRASLMETTNDTQAASIVGEVFAQHIRDLAAMR